MAYDKEPPILKLHVPSITWSCDISTRPTATKLDKAIACEKESPTTKVAYQITITTKKNATNVITRPMATKIGNIMVYDQGGPTQKVI